MPMQPGPTTPDVPGPDPRPVLLLVNLGTPEAPTPRAVRRYLAQFLHDRRVVARSRWLWCPLLHFVILPQRSPRVARKYAQVWLQEGSPLAVHTRRLAVAVQRLCPQWRVLHAMRYGRPALDAALAALHAQGARRVLVLPLYPQYSTTTTASVADVLAAAGAGLELRMVPDYHRDPGWVEAVAAAVHAYWQAHGRGAKLVFSFHGIPQRLVDAGDPYRAQCEASVAAIAQALGLAPDEFVLAFQSRFGREAWLQPATAQVLRDLATAGVGTVDVVCPGFAVDCLETLEEIADQAAALFRAHGGQALRYIPCLNDAPAHAAALAAIADHDADIHADAHAGAGPARVGP